MHTLELHDFNPINNLSKDLKAAARLMSRAEVRFLVDSYYQVQESRKATSNQVRSMSDTGEPTRVVQWFLDNSQLLEGQIKRALQAYAENNPVGEWSLSVYGIGPVIAAGLLAHIDIRKAPTAGNIWSFAGLSPGQEWAKGKRRPWNAALKTLCWKIGQSFLKFHTNDKCYYGKLFAQRWEQEKARNEAGLYADQAKQKLEKFNIGRTTDAYAAYSQGRLPPAHILQRACRWTEKLFLAHWHWVAYEAEYGRPPANPWVVEHGGHAHVIPPPGWKS